MRSLSPATSAKLFATGFSVGPIVDSLHNQCLLKYDILPISLAWPLSSSPDAVSMMEQNQGIVQEATNYFFCSSWTVPPLLGIAYVVLGGILPRIFEFLFPMTTITKQVKQTEDSMATFGHQQQQQQQPQLKRKAIIAVVTTAMIIKLSEYLEATNPGVTDTILGSLTTQDAHLLVMLTAAISQWAILDGTIAALLAATITSLGGPLSELPFVANGVWEYLDAASDYFPLANIENNNILKVMLGDGYQNLALSSSTGPCYFAVTMDAIALGRWFDSQEAEKSRESNP